MGKMQFCAMDTWFRDEAVHFLHSRTLILPMIKVISKSNFSCRIWDTLAQKWVWKHEVYPNSFTYPHLSPVLCFFSNKITVSPGVQKFTKPPGLTYSRQVLEADQKQRHKSAWKCHHFFTGYRDAFFDVTECHLIIVVIYWKSWFSSETWWNHSHTKVLWWSKSFGVAVFAQEPGSSLSDHLAVLTERKKWTIIEKTSKQTKNWMSLCLNKGTPPWGGCGFSTIVYLVIESKITFLHCNLQYFMLVIYDVLTFAARCQNAKKNFCNSATSAWDMNT